MKAFYPEFAIAEKAVAVVETYLAVAYRFYFRTGEHNTSLQPVFNGIFEGGGTVLYVDFFWQG
jgi:hypothetical protein